MQFDLEKINQYLFNFRAYIEHRSNMLLDMSNDLTSNKFFMDKKQEGYKKKVYEDARKTLGFNTWTDERSDEIINGAKGAINKAQNLVFANQQIHFKDKNDENPEIASKILYNIFCRNDDRKSFEEAVAFWGAKYDLIAYLFFLKDKERYLPISPGNFDNKFAKLGIDLRMSHRCSYENYLSFVGCIDELRAHMEQYFDFGVSLLDAHSVIWMMDSVENFVTKLEELSEDEILIHELSESFSNGDYEESIIDYGEAPRNRREPRFSNGRKIYPRSKQMSLSAFSRANYQCEINNSHHSFIRKNSDIKYMEAHHLIPMSQYEFFPNLDIPENIVCLCSNCHNEIHYGEKANDMIKKLFAKRQMHLKEMGIEIKIEDLLKMY